MKGRLALMLFAAPFLCVGVWMAFAVGGHLVDAARMASWVGVPAELHAGGYKTNSGGDATTYEAFADYTYEWQGKIYRGRRVAIASGADNIGDFQRDLGRRLSRSASIEVYVNPQDPQMAVIDRSLRWGLMGFKTIFLLVFGGVGAGLMAWGFLAPKPVDAAAPEFAESPWLADARWQTAEVRSSARPTMWFAWGFAALWNLISAPLPFIVYSEWVDKGNALALIGLLFPLVGAGLLTWAYRAIRQWRRYGATPFLMDPFPGSIGGHVGGGIVLNMPHEPGLQFKATLSCMESTVTGSGKHRSRRESPLWQKEQLAYVERVAEGVRVSVRFDVPQGLPQSDVDRTGRRYVVWRLSLSGADYQRDFEIPVYPTSLLSEQLSGAAASEAEVLQDDLDRQAVQAIIQTDSRGSERRILYPTGRHTRMGAIGLLIGGVFAATGVFLFRHEEAYVIGSVFTLIGFAVGLASLYLMSNSLEVIGGVSAIRSVRRVLGIPVRSSRLLRAQFQRFTMKSTLSTTSSSGTTMYYTLSAVDVRGREVVLGEGFRGAGQAEAAAELLSELLTLEAREPPMLVPRHVSRRTARAGSRESDAARR